MFFLIVTCSLHVLTLQVMFSGKIIELLIQWVLTFVWMKQMASFMR